MTLNEEEVKRDIISMYEAVRSAYFDGNFKDSVFSIIKKYGIEVDEDGCVNEEE